MTSCISNDTESCKFTINESEGSTTKGLVYNGNKIGIWETTFKKNPLKKIEFYGYNPKIGNFVKVKESYLKNETPITNIIYINEHISNIDYLNFYLLDSIYPFIGNTLGFQLFSTNCLNCHRYFPIYQENDFKESIIKLEENNLIVSFLHNGRTPDEINKLYLFHPSFLELDSFEINSIINYILIQNDSTIIPL